jgi:hypothetical protein
MSRPTTLATQPSTLSIATSYRLSRNPDTGGEFVRAEREGARRPNAWCVPEEYPPASPPLARS